MHIRLIAVGDRQPQWVDEAFQNYSRRFPPQWKFRLDVIATAKRKKAENARRAIETEGELILGKLAGNEQAGRLSGWQADGRDLAFIIGGPDGVSDDCRQRADFVWSLSDLTLPHGLARVLLGEQLYRAWSLASGHPYHRC
jgi:23S rRNA (pseudouridine1915-N3)-methyltransferase